MKTKPILMAGWIAVGLAATARGEFIPGHVFVAQMPGKVCNDPAAFGSDLIWEIDPQTGQATLFLEIPDELCGFISGLAFTPDGSRLRASMRLRNEIWEFDSQANFTVVLDQNDGIACPAGLNNLAYDAAGNFYVVNKCTRNILRFPPDGGPPTVFADADDGVGAGGSIAFAANGDLYFTTGLNGINLLRRITPEGNAFPFDSFGSIISPEGVTADDSGHVYVGLKTGEVLRYNAGDPESKESLGVFPFRARHSMAMSPDQSMIYVNVFGGGALGRLLGIDVVDGTVTTLAEFLDEGAFLSLPAGIAVVPPAPIPTVSTWGILAMALSLLWAGVVVLRRRVRTTPE